MNYLLKTNGRGLMGGSSSGSGRNKNPLSLGRVVGGVLILIIALWWIFYTPTFISVASHKVASVVTSSSSGVGSLFSGISTYFPSKSSLAKENEMLKDKLFAQDVSIVNLELIKRQNSELKEALNRADSKNIIAAAVIRGVASSPYDTFLIDGGKKAGIVPGDLVLIRSAIPIGYVSKVFEKSAEVTMYSSSGETVEGVLTFREGATKGGSIGKGIEGNEGNGGIDGVGGDVATISSEPQSESVSAGTGRLRTLFVTVTGKGGGNFLVRLTKDIDVPSGAEIAMTGLTPRILATVYGSEIDAAGGSRILYALSPVNMLHESVVYIQSNHE